MIITRAQRIFAEGAMGAKDWDIPQSSSSAEKSREHNDPRKLPSSMCSIVRVEEVGKGKSQQLPTLSTTRKSVSEDKVYCMYWTYFKRSH